MAAQRPPRWNWASICAPFVGYLVGVLATAVGEGVLWERRGPVNNVAIMISIAFCVLGLVAAGVALIRKERLWGLTAVGIVFNAPLPMIVLYIFVFGLFGPV